MIVLTGACGFIGSRMLKALNARGHSDIICVERFPRAGQLQRLCQQQFADFHFENDFRRAIATKHKILGINITAIIHLGATTTTLARNGMGCLHNNFVFTRNMIELAHTYNAPILYASSASVYGQGVAGFREEPECEKPQSIYACSKYMADQYVREHIPIHKSRRRPGGFKVPVIGARYFNVYGPGEEYKLDMMSLAGKILRSARGLPPTIAEHDSHAAGATLFDGSENIKRDFIYIDDAVDASLFLLDHATLHTSGVYNIGTGVARSFSELARICDATTGKTVLRPEQPIPKILSEQYQRYTCADISKLRRYGYLETMAPLEAGIARYWAEQLTNP